MDPLAPLGKELIFKCRLFPSLTFSFRTEQKESDLPDLTGDRFILTRFRSLQCRCAQIELSTVDRGNVLLHTIKAATFFKQKEEPARFPDKSKISYYGNDLIKAHTHVDR